VALELAALARGAEVKILTLREFINDWVDDVERRKLSDTTKRDYKDVTSRFLAFMGEDAEMAVDQVEPTHIKNYLTDMEKEGRSPRTIKKHLSVLKSSFREAVTLRKLTYNPVTAVKPPKAEETHKEAFTVQELRNILETCSSSKNGNEWETAIRLGFYCGMRLGDATNLSWSNIDLNEQKITFTPEKTSKVVELPIHKGLHDHLMQLPTSDDPLAPLCPTLSRAQKGHRGILSKQFSKIVSSAGVEVRKAGDGVRKVSNKSFHSLRHTLVSHLAEKNVAEEIRMQLSAHQDKRVHAGYTHLQFKEMQTALNKLEGLE
jgi:integrase